MKKYLILPLFIFCWFFTYSQNQNGGQFNENNSIRLQYLGYNSGTHTFKIVNKQNCEVTIRTKVDTESAIDMQTLSNDSFYVNVPRSNPGNVKFRVKSETSCSQNIDMGWLEINTSGFTLPLVDDNVIRIVRGPNEYKVHLIGNVLFSDFGQLSEKQTIVIHTLFGEKLYFNRIFVSKKSQIDLNQFMKQGINLITVFIDNKTRDIFTFRILKL
jgi:hypothetical protein